MEQCQWQHSSVEDQLGAVAFQCKMLETFQLDAYFLGVGLVVVGDVIGAYCGSCFMEKILPFREAQDNAVFRVTFGLDAVDDSLQDGAGILLAVSFQAHLGKVIGAFGAV
ncbi:toxin-antitoxin system, toxin component, GNAT domain protein [Bacteroides fluxus YIT 12057]|uniref:Toxin-antitoxin system, toxin component, GNAT domain protein n=1 Tax=Bacteroides fluxus YIT 12057 TaxID=763034 RepID=F3PSV9_9BACE|nr:toxin-antitoxin system, toxin component, GNAT domain protein [Bacteroides fluxus YIT 12057]